MTAAFTIRDLTIFYDNKQAVRDVSVEIPRNAIMGIIGPSGCGKSSFLRALNRMNDLIPKSRITGDVLFHDLNIYHPDVDEVELRRRVGMVFQKPNPFPFSIFDNVAYGLRIAGMRDRAFLARKVEESLKKAALWTEVKDRLDRPAVELSGGQQQRLCIARTLAIDPEVLLLDEPCASLDPISTHAIEQTLLRLKPQYTIVIVTHNMQQARRLSDNTMFFNDGNLVEHGPTIPLFEESRHAVTRDYVQGNFG